jgi:hypothetical protein
LSRAYAIIGRMSKVQAGGESSATGDAFSACAS